MSDEDHETRKIISFAVNDFLLIILKSNVSEKTFSDCLLAINATYVDVVYMKKTSQVNTEEDVRVTAGDMLKRRYIGADDYRKQTKNL